MLMSGFCNAKDIQTEYLHVVQLTRIRRLATLIAAYDFPAALCALMFALIWGKGPAAVVGVLTPSRSVVLLLFIRCKESS